VGVKKSLLVALAALALANAITLWHVARNSAGVPDTSITLNSEALSSLSRSDAKDEDSSVNFNIRWQYPGMPETMDDLGWPRIWIAREALKRLGFDCSVSPASSDAQAFYRRQPSRRAFVAMQLATSGTGLTLLETAVDSNALRGRYPDSKHVLILPAIVTIQVTSGTGVPALTAIVDKVPTQIHIPKPFSTQIRTHPNAAFRLHLTYGSLHEPRVTGVDFSTPR